MTFFFGPWVRWVFLKIFPWHPGNHIIIWCFRRFGPTWVRTTFHMKVWKMSFLWKENSKATVSNVLTFPPLKNRKSYWLQDIARTSEAVRPPLFNAEKQIVHKTHSKKKTSHQCSSLSPTPGKKTPQKVDNKVKEQSKAMRVYKMHLGHQTAVRANVNVEMSWLLGCPEVLLIWRWACMCRIWEIPSLTNIAPEKMLFFGKGKLCLTLTFRIFSGTMLVWDSVYEIYYFWWKYGWMGIHDVM